MAGPGTPPRLEFEASTKWAAAYQRNNKANGQKNLRCFPAHCQGLGHQHGFCGHSLVVNLYFKPEEHRGALVAIGFFGVSESEALSDAIVGAKGVCKDRFSAGDRLPLSSVYSRVRDSEAPLQDYIEGYELSDQRREEGGGVARVKFEFNRNLRGWHYGFLGSKLTRNVRHAYKAYVLEKVPATAGVAAHFVVLAGVSSPEWTLFCRRRLRTTILSPEQIAARAAAGLPPRGLPGKGGDEEEEEDSDDDAATTSPAHRASPASAAARPSLQQAASSSSAPPARRQVKKRRDTAPEPGQQLELLRSLAAEAEAVRKLGAPRRMASCPAEPLASASASAYAYPYAAVPSPYAFFAQQPQQQPQFMEPGRGRSFSDQLHAPLFSGEPFYHPFGGGAGAGAGGAEDAEDARVKPYVRRHASLERIEASGRSGLSTKRASGSEEELWEPPALTQQQLVQKHALCHVLAMFELVDKQLTYKENNMEKIAKGLAEMGDAFIGKPHHNIYCAVGATETEFAIFLLDHSPFLDKITAWAKSSPTKSRLSDKFTTGQFGLSLLNQNLPAFFRAKHQQQLVLHIQQQQQQQQQQHQQHELQSATSTLSLLGLGSLINARSTMSLLAAPNLSDGEFLAAMEKRVSSLDLGRAKDTPNNENKPLNSQLESLANFTESLAPLEGEELPGPLSWRISAPVGPSAHSFAGMSFMLNKSAPKLANSSKSLGHAIALPESKHDDLEQFLVRTGAEMVDDEDD